MPQVLSSNFPHLRVVSLQQQQVQHGEGCLCSEEEREEYRNVIEQNADMDFFTDECDSSVFIAAATGCENGDSSRGRLEDNNRVVPCPPERVSQTLQETCNQQRKVFTDCEVTLHLRLPAGDGQGSRFVICIPAAISLPASPVEPFASPIDDMWVYHIDGMPKVENVEEEDAAMARNWGAMPMTRERSMETEAGAARSPNSACGVDLIKGRRVVRKTSLPADDAETLRRHCDAPFSSTVPLVPKEAYTMQLPLGFVLTLRLPAEVENALVKWQKDEAILMGVPSPPLWVSAFLYTTTLRRQFFSSSSATPAAGTRGLVEEPIAVATLEGLCIVALKVISQMGHLRQRQKILDRCVDAEMTTTATTRAQNVLLDDVSFFSTMQEDQLRCWLQRYLPLEACVGAEDMEGSFSHGYCLSSWPSAPAVVFYLALNLAQVLFPSLLQSLESTVLSAMQPLLEVCDAESMTSSSFTSSLCQPSSRKKAVLLLTQRPAMHWLWWQQNDVNMNRNGYRCTSAVTASMGYGALRVLHSFTHVHGFSVADGPVFTQGDSEECEVAQFLLSAPVLFSKLLLDREVTGIIERSAKEVTLLSYTSNEKGSIDQLCTRVVPQTTRALMRCFFALLCWLAFRPAGYSNSVARAHFGLLLRLTASLHERQLQHDLLHETNHKEQSLYLLEICSRDYFSLASTFLRVLRDGCESGRCEKTSRVNPWRRLRHFEKTKSVFTTGDGLATSTAESHHSVRSFISSTTASAESTVAPRFSSKPASATNMLTTLFSTQSLYALRFVIRHIRSVLRLLKRDVFDAKNASSTTGGSEEETLFVFGMKRSREMSSNVNEERMVEALRKERNERGENEEGAGKVDFTTFLPWRQRARSQMGVSPHIAHHVYGMPDPSLLHGYMECDDSTDDDSVTGTSESRSGGTSSSSGSRGKNIM